VGQRVADLDDRYRTPLYHVEARTAALADQRHAQLTAMDVDQAWHYRAAGESSHWLTCTSSVTVSTHQRRLMGGGVPFATVLEVVAHEALREDFMPGRVTSRPRRPSHSIGFADLGHK
jgi:hypothetical protein